jgi:hypothetical protein
MKRVASFQDPVRSSRETREGAGAMAGTGMEMKGHERTYTGFLSLLKYGTIAAFVVAAIVVILIAS